MGTSDFNFIFLGQSVLKYQVPLDIYYAINDIYEKKFSLLKPANKQLVGKIKNEHSLFNSKENYNFLSKDVLDWFESRFKHYLDWNKIKEYQYNISSIWVNEMKEHEYNPVHVHQGNLFTGLSSVMILKIPQSFGEEYSASIDPQNGKLQLFGNNSGQFATMDYQPGIEERDFYVFPYDVRHCVYPFNGPGLRRTLAANCDIIYNPIKNRGVS